MVLCIESLEGENIRNKIKKRKYQNQGKAYQWGVVVQLKGKLTTKIYINIKLFLWITISFSTIFIFKLHYLHWGQWMRNDRFTHSTRIKEWQLSILILIMDALLIPCSLKVWQRNRKRLAIVVYINTSKRFTKRIKKKKWHETSRCYQAITIYLWKYALRMETCLH